MAKTQEAILVAAAFGFDVNLINVQELQPDTHKNIVIYRLFDPNGKDIPYRLQNMDTGLVYSKLDSDVNFDPLMRDKSGLVAWQSYIKKFGIPKNVIVDAASVDAAYNSVNDLQSVKNAKFLPALQTRFPGVDFSAVTWEAQNGKLVVDITSLTTQQQTFAVNALAQSNYADKVTLITG